MRHTKIRMPVMLILATMILAAGTAAAEYAKKLEPRIMPAAEEPGRRRGGACISGNGLDESDRAATCEPYTYTVYNGADTGVVWYEYKIAILDDPREGTRPADTMYVSDRTRSNEFTYTFYRTGTYVLFAYRYDKYGEIVWNNGSKNMQHRIYITEDSVGNPLNAAVTAAAEDCRRDSDFDTAVAINDYLADRVTYDYSYTYYSPEAALLRGMGVCNSYSRAYELIAKACGLNCRRVIGSVSGGAHAWNAAEINGKWYQLDATWNDSENKAGRHIYMGLSDEVIGNDHFNAEYPYEDGGVTCDSLEDNYYIHTGKWRESANAGEKHGESSVMSGVQEALNGLSGENGTITSGFGGKAWLEDGESYTDSSGKVRIIGAITAYALSRETLVRTADGVRTPMKGMFTYTHSGNGGILTGEMAESGLTISGLKETYDTGESIQATAAFDTAGYEGDPEGLTLETWIFYEGHEEDRQESGTVTYAGEGLELNTAGWRLYGTGNAVMEAAVRKGDGPVISRTRKTFTVAASRGEMNLSAPDIPACFTPGECILRPFTDVDEAGHPESRMRVTVTARDDENEDVRYDTDGMDLNAGISFTASEGEYISISITVTEDGYDACHYSAKHIPAVSGMNPVTLAVNPPGETTAICTGITVTVNAEGAEQIRLEDSEGRRWGPENGEAAVFEAVTGEKEGRYSIWAVVEYGDGTERASGPWTAELIKAGEIPKTRMEAEFSDPQGHLVIECGGEIRVSFISTGDTGEAETGYELLIDSMNGTLADIDWEWTDEANHVLVIRTGGMPAGAYRMSGKVSAPGYVPYYTSRDGEIQFVVKAVPERDPEKLTKLVLPEGLERIEADAFTGIAVQAVIIPESCTYIGSNAFRNCPNLVYAEYFAGTTVEDDAFAACSNPEIRVIEK